MSEDAKHTAQYQWSNNRLRHRAKHPDSWETRAFDDGWDAAMNFMASPRIPLTIEYPHLVGSMDPVSPQFFEDAERPGMMRKGVNPYGLVAFYTDAP